MFCGEFHSEHV